jgi:hypothetical protein
MQFAATIDDPCYSGVRPADGLTTTGTNLGIL